MDIIFDKIIAIICSRYIYIPIITIIISIFLINASKKIVKKLIHKSADSIEAKRRNTIVSLAQNIIKYVILIIALLVCLSTWGVNISAFLTGLGILGVVGGLAIQDALKDIIMGCNIIMDNYYVVGDLVRYEDFTGTVIEFGLKNTKIVDYDGVVLVLANREISKIYNLSQHSSIISINVPVAYEESEDKVSKSLNKICEEVDTWDITTDRTEYLGIDELSNSSVTYLLRAYCKSGNQYELKRKILGLVKKTLENDNIKIPYPQIEVHNGKDI